MTDSQIRIPVRDRAAPLSEAGIDAGLLGAEDAAVTGQLVADAMVATDCRTVGDLINMVERADPAERRAILNRARVGAGLDTVEDVEAHDRYVAANRALKPRPPQRCAACGVTPLTAEGMPDLNVPQARRWWCDAHRDQAAPGDLDPPASGINLDMRPLPNPDEVAREQRKDERRAEQARQRAEDRQYEATQAAEAKQAADEAWRPTGPGWSS